MVKTIEKIWICNFGIAWILWFFSLKIIWKFFKTIELNTFEIIPFSACNCNEDGSVDQNCNARGKCTCKENVIGDKCDQIVEAFYDITDPKGTYLNTLECQVNAGLCLYII